MAEIATFIQTIKLPVMPEVAHALIRTLNDEDADVASVRAVIAKDPALTAVLLRMANSAVFGLSRTVDSLESAVRVVGMSQIRARALSVCMANAFKLPPSLNRLEFWRYNMVCAGYARWLASNVGLDEHQAWLTGMMLRLGELAIAQRDVHLLTKIERMPCAPGERWARERSALGFDEGEITAEFAHRWDLPEVVAAGLESSCQPMVAAKFSKLAGVVHLAGLLADYENPDPKTLEEMPVAVLTALKLDGKTLGSNMPSAESLSDVSMLQA